MMYPIFYFVLCIHGIEGLLQDPRFHWYLTFPAIIFTIDKIIEIRRSYVEVIVKGNTDEILFFLLDNFFSI